MISKLVLCLCTSVQPYCFLPGMACLATLSLSLSWWACSHPFSQSLPVVWSMRCLHLYWQLHLPLQWPTEECNWTGPRFFQATQWNMPKASPRGPWGLLWHGPAQRSCHANQDPSESIQSMSSLSAEFYRSLLPDNLWPWSVGLDEYKCKRFSAIQRQ